MSSSILGPVTRLPPLSKTDLRGIDSQTSRVLESIISHIQVYQGSGNRYDKVVTLRDLYEGGLASLKVNGEYLVNPNPDGTLNPPDPGGGNIDPGTPPGPVTGLTASGAIFSIHLKWNGVASAEYYEVWRADVDDLGQAVRIGISSTNLYSDGVGADVSKYYWARGVNVWGEGPFNSSAGTLGQTSADPTDVLALLTGAITESHLYTTLNSRIDLIDTAGTGLVDVTSGLQSSVSTLNSTVSTIQGGLVRTFVQTGAPSDPHLGDLWYNPSDNTRVKRWNGSTWEYVDDARIATAISDIGTNASAISTLDSRVDTAEADILANAAAITALSVSSGQGIFDPAEDGLFEFENSADGWTDTDIDQTLNSYYITLDATASSPKFDSPSGNTWNGGLYTQVIARIRRAAGTGWVGDVHYATSAAGSNHGFSESYYANISKPTGFDDSPYQWFIVAWDMESLTAGGTDWVDNVITQIRLELGTDGSDTIDVDWIAVARYSPAASSAALNSLEARVTQNESDISTNASDITALESTVNNGTTGVAANASAISSLQTSVSTNTTNIATNASDITALETTVNHPTTGVAANASAISSLQTDVTAAEGTISTHTSQISVLTSDLSTANSNISGNASAITALDTRVTSAEGTITSQASSITQIQADVAGNTAAISTEASVRAADDGLLAAEYTLKLDVNGHVAGLGVAVSGGASGPITSQMILLADQIAMALPTITFQATTAYTVGQYIKPTVATGFIYKVTVAGTTGSTEPTWPTTLGNTVGSGGVTFQCVSIQETIPFVVGSVSGNPAVVLSTAYIADASITNAKIVDLAAEKISAGTISASIELTAATVTGGLIRTADDTGVRAEMTDQGSFVFWYGSGTKSAANAKLYLDTSGNAVFSGQVTGAIVTGGTIRTATSGQRIEMDGTNNELYFYDAGNNLDATIGVSTVGVDDVVGLFGRSVSGYGLVGVFGRSYNNNGVKGYSENAPGGYFYSNNNIGVYGLGVTSGAVGVVGIGGSAAVGVSGVSAAIGVKGSSNSSSGVGVYGENLSSGGGKAIRGYANYGAELDWYSTGNVGGPLKLVKKSGFGYPSHNADDGTFFYRSGQGLAPGGIPLFFMHDNLWWQFAFADDPEIFP